MNYSCNTTSLSQKKISHGDTDENGILELLMDSDIIETIDHDAHENGKEVANQYSSLPTSDEKIENLEQNIDYENHDDKTTKEIVTCTPTPCTMNECTDEDQNERLQNHSTCPICLKAFERGEDISWSKQLVCLHVFHKDCLTPWLMKHDDCPVCRSKMVYDSRIDDNSTKPRLGSRWQHPNNQHEKNAGDANAHYDSLDDDMIEEGLFIRDGMILFDRPRQHPSTGAAQCQISYDDISEISENNQK